jgi:hypothetical protein
MPIRGFEMKSPFGEHGTRNQLQGRGVGLSWVIMPFVSNHPTPDLRALVARLGGKWSGNTAMCRCPSHADRTPSLAIRQGDRGILVTCHAGCDATDVLRALRSIADLPSIGPAETLGRQARQTSAYLAIWQAGGRSRAHWPNGMSATSATSGLRLTTCAIIRAVREDREGWSSLSPLCSSRCVKRARSPQSSGFFSIQ